MQSNISRRSLLRGLGAGSVLVGGVNRSVLAAAENKPLPRAAFFFHANGAHPGWAPSGAGATFTLTPHLKPLADAGITGDVVFIKNMNLMRKNVAPPAPANSHHTTTYSALGAGASTSFDQVLAKSALTERAKDLIEELTA